MSSYVEQSKAWGARMNALLHAFVLCQLWTLYLEELAGAALPSSDHHYTTVCILLDFWCKLVPSILQVTVQSKVVRPRHLPDIDSYTHISLLHYLCIIIVS